MYLTNKVLDFVLGKSKIILGPELRRYINVTITDEDCRHGIVYLLQQMVTKILSNSQLDAICGHGSHEILEKI